MKRSKRTHIGWARGINPRAHGDATRIWHAVVSEDGAVSAFAGCGKRTPIGGQIEKLPVGQAVNVCQRIGCGTRVARDVFAAEKGIPC